MSKVPNGAVEAGLAREYLVAALNAERARRELITHIAKNPHVKEVLSGLLDEFYVPEDQQGLASLIADAEEHPWWTRTGEDT